MTLEDDSFSKYGEFTYSNIGYHLISMILRSVTNDSYSNLVRHYVLGPLNLRNTFMPNEFENAGNSIKLKRPVHNLDVSQSYYFINDQIETNKIFNWDTSAGGMYSTLDDLLNFTYNYFRDEGAFFSANSRRLRDTDPVTVVENIKYGIGFFIDPNGAKGHMGSDTGSNAIAQFDQNLNMTTAIVVTSERVTLEIADLILAKGRKKSETSQNSLVYLNKRFEIIKELRKYYTMDQIVAMRKLAKSNPKAFYMLFKLSHWIKNPICN